MEMQEPPELPQQQQQQRKEQNASVSDAEEQTENFPCEPLNEHNRDKTSMAPFFFKECAS